MNDSKNLGLYIHVPFCASKCAYCDFYSVTDKNRIDVYLKAVLQHAKEYAALLQGFPVDTIYFGGGTPTVLGERHLTRLLTELKRLFRVTSNPEITLEANPESTDKKSLKKLRRAGFNRISFGMQSSDDSELKLLGRIHSFQQVKDAFHAAREAGFDNISLDLMYGLPAENGGVQSAERFLSSLEESILLGPEHLSIYSLTLEPSTPMGQKKPPLPDDDKQAEMYIKASDKLRYHGFEHYEISNFAKPGRRSRHNSKYWDLSDYLGLGPGAHSLLAGKRFAFVRDLDAYCKGIAPGGGPIVSEEEDVPMMQRHGEYIMLRLRTLDGVDETQFENMFHRDFTPFAKKLAPLVEPGYVRHDMGRWSLTEKGFLVSNTIILDTLDAEDIEDSPDGQEKQEDGTCAQ